MRPAALLFAVAACTSSSQAPICVPEEACAPGDSCKLGKVQCSPSILCIATDAGVPDGTACGSGQVCAAGACVACAQGQACAPAGNPCHAGVIQCGSGAAVCSDTNANAPDGASCGADLLCVSGACAPGDGSDGSLTISASQRFQIANTTCTGTQGATSLTVANSAGFPAGQPVLVHQSSGTGAGGWEEAIVAGAPDSTTLSLKAPLQRAYAPGAQVIAEPRFTDVTIASGGTLTALPWNGATGGIVAFKVRGNLLVQGRISLSGLGYRGGSASASNADYVYNQAGEGESGQGPVRGTDQRNGEGGGAGCGQGSGGGGGNGGAGGGGQAAGCSAPPSGSCTGTAAGQGGATDGSADLTSALFGGGGGASGSHNDSGRNGAPGGSGGGFLFAHAGTISVTGEIDADGSNGANGYDSGSPTFQPVGGGGGGAGGSVRLTAAAIHIAGTFEALGGGGGSNATGTNCSPSGTGGPGGDGRIFLAAPDITGTTHPAATTGAGP